MSSEAWIKPAMNAIRADHLERTLRVREGAGACTTFDGNVCLNFSANDYLNLSANPLLLKAAAEGSVSGSGASRLLAGTFPAHIALEEELADFFGYKSCLMFGSGYLANIGVLQSLASRSDVVFSDKLIHASLIDGIQLSRAEHFRYRHNDLNHLEGLLKKAASSRRQGQKFVLITESVFSMDGDTAPLEDISSLAKAYDALVVVDEAHAVGVFGPGGRGLVSEFNLGDKISLVNATLSKAFGGYGGFSLCSELVKRYLVNTARSFIYSTALPPAVVESARAALSFIQDNAEQGELLLSRAFYFRKLLQESGFDTLNSESQIVPVMIGENEAALKLAERLKEQGVLALAVRAPTVPPGSARLRFSVTLAHTEADLQYAAHTLEKEAKELGVV